MTFVVGTDGSDLAVQAAVSGLSVLKPGGRVVVVAVADLVDPSLAQDATGHAAASMTPGEVDAQHRASKANGEAAVEATVAALRDLGLAAGEVETAVIEGEPGPALCAYAAEIGAAAIAVGSRGRGGIKRALLGSVSDFVVRNAPCPVVVSRPASS